jgi:hypothetical protein
MLDGKEAVPMQESMDPADIKRMQKRERAAARGGR